MSVSQWITRRGVLRSGLAAAFVPSLPALANTPETPETLAHDAYIWGYPLVMFGRYLDTYKAQGNPINRFVVQSALSTPATPGGGPNVDTIYGYSWLDLRGGPQVLHVPDVGDRYYSIQLIDMYGDCFAYVGRRATGTKAGAYAIVGPDWKGTLPAGVKAVPAPTNDVMTFARTFVADEADMPAVRAIQGQYAFGDLGISQRRRGRRSQSRRCSCRRSSTCPRPAPAISTNCASGWPPIRRAAAMSPI